MDSSRSDDSDISDSEIIDRIEKSYTRLRSKQYKVQVVGRLRCPFCPGKKKQSYKYKELLQHASGVGKGSAKRSGKQKANHLALVRYLEVDLDDLANNRILAEQKKLRKELASMNKDVACAAVECCWSLFLFIDLGLVLTPLSSVDAAAVKRLFGGGSFGVGFDRFGAVVCSQWLGCWSVPVGCFGSSGVVLPMKE
ncbi:Factor of DNA methylation 5 [Linum grandiflorum]